MLRTCVLLVALAGIVFCPVALSQGGQNDSSRSIAGGGVSVVGWMGKIDAKEAQAGMTLNSAKFAKEGDAFHVVTGPAVTYWNPANNADRSPTTLSVTKYFESAQSVMGGTRRLPHGMYCTLPATPVRRRTWRRGWRRRATRCWRGIVRCWRNEEYVARQDCARTMRPGVSSWPSTWHGRTKPATN